MSAHQIEVVRFLLKFDKTKDFFESIKIVRF